MRRLNGSTNFEIKNRISLCNFLCKPARLVEGNTAQAAESGGAPRSGAREKTTIGVIIIKITEQL